MLFRRVRPRFRARVPFSMDETVARVVARVERPDRPCQVMVSGRHGVVELRVNDDEQRSWSPVLAVTVTEAEDGSGSDVHGLVGPNPNLWTLFAMLYMGLWTGIMFAGVFGLVQWSLGESPWGLWVTAGLVTALVTLYAASRFGQHLGAGQTAALRRVLEDALELPVAERALTRRDPYHEEPASS
jgi:hypothetical protein